MAERYYVYVYIDPRNHEEFYYGKGTGSRKDAHLTDDSDSAKAKRIKDIKRDTGGDPIIRVVAAGLTESEAFLVESTLLWKLRGLTNVASGHFQRKFRPRDTLHRELPGFDFQNGVYFFNTGADDGYRDWDSCRAHGFISAGGGPSYRDAILGFEVGDVFAAYLKRRGFVGVGKVRERARPLRDIRTEHGLLMDQLPAGYGYTKHPDSETDCEFVALVDWIRAVPAGDAKWQARSGLFAPQNVRATLVGQPDTIAFVNEAFGVNLLELIK